MDRICPWWLAYTFDNPIRRLFHQPEVMLAAYVKEGMTALDLGCGMGFFTIGMAKMVGPKGRVISVDLQEKMLAITQKRARQAGVLERITPVQGRPTEIGVKDQVDFALAVWMVHEVPDQKTFLSQVRVCLKPEARFMIIEPKHHVKEESFRQTLSLAREAGLTLLEQPRVKLSHAAALAPS